MFSSSINQTPKSINQSISLSVYQRLLELYYSKKTDDKGDEPYLFHSLWKGDLDEVHEFYKRQIIGSIGFKWNFEWNRIRDEAALDLAIHLGHKHIIIFLSEEYERNEYLIEINRNDLDTSENNEMKQSFHFEFNQNEFVHDVNILLSRDNTISLEITYFTHLQYPYLQETFSDLKGMNLSTTSYLGMGQYGSPMSLDFHYKYTPQNENDICLHFSQICAGLNQLTNEKVDKLSFALTNLFEHAKNDLAIAKSQNQPTYPQLTTSQRFTSFIDYMIYDAAKTFDHKKMRTLLRYGANPNSFKDRTSILCLVLLYGVDRVIKLAMLRASFNEQQFLNDLAKTRKVFEVLLEYGADPFLIFLDKKNFLHRLIDYDRLCDPATFTRNHLHPKAHHLIRKDRLLREFFRDLVYLLPTSEKSWKSILIHHRFTESLIVKSILTVNQHMRTVANKKNYISNVLTEQTINHQCINFNLRNNNKISIETRKANDLSAKEYKTLEEYFEKESKTQVCGSKSEYFKNEMTSNAGTTFVDLIKINNNLAGIYIYEYINVNLNDRPTFIHYVKLVVADKLKDSPNLIKFIILLRGFCCTIPNHIKLTYADVATHHGFALADIMKRYPTHYIPEINMDDIISVVQKGKKLDIKNEAYYLKNEQLRASKDVEIKTSTSDLVSLSFLSCKTFATKYHIPDHSLCVAFLNDKENFQRLKDAILPIIGSQYFFKIFSFYAQHVNEFVLSSQPNQASAKKAKL